MHTGTHTAPLLRAAQNHSLPFKHLVFFKVVHVPQVHTKIQQHPTHFSGPQISPTEKIRILQFLRQSVAATWKMTQMKGEFNVVGEHQCQYLAKLHCGSEGGDWAKGTRDPLCHFLHLHRNLQFSVTIIVLKYYPTKGIQSPDTRWLSQ